MDYLKQGSVVVFVLLAAVQAQNFAEDSFISRYNENKNSRSPNDFAYNVINEEIPNYIDSRSRESFHDIYTFKGQDGETRRLHYAVDNNGPRADFQSNAVQFGQNIDSNENTFGARLRARPVIRQSIPPQGYSIRNLNEDIPNMQALNVEVEKPAMLPEPFVPLNAIQYPVTNNLLDQNSNAPTLQDRTSPEYQSPPSYSEPILPFFPVDPNYDSQRISNPESKHTYSSLSKNFPSIASEYIPLNENKPEKKSSEYLIPFESIPLVPNRFDTSNNDAQVNYSQINPSDSEYPSYSKISTTYLEDNPINVQLIDSEKDNHAFQPVLQQKQDKEPNFATESETKVLLNEKMNNSSLPKNSILSIQQQKQKPATVNSYFTTKSQLATSQSPNNPISKTLLSSPMSTVFDTSNENGGYYHYVMNLGQKPKKKWDGKTKIYSTGNALYKLLNETGIHFQSSLKTNAAKKVLNSSFKNNAKVLDILSAMSKKMNGQKSTNKVTSDLDVAGDVIDALNTSNVPSNTSNLKTVNYQLVNKSENHVINTDETSTPTTKLPPHTTAEESSTPSKAATEPYTVSSFLENLFDIHATTSYSEPDNYQETPSTSTQSTSNFYFGETPLYITEIETPLNLKIVPANLTENGTSITTKSPYDPTTFSSRFSTEITTTNEATQSVTTVKVGTPSTLSEEYSTLVPTSTPSVSNVSSDNKHRTTLAEIMYTNKEGNNVSTIQELTTNISTESTTYSPESSTPMSPTEKDFQSNINDSVQNETVIVELVSSNNSKLNNQVERMDEDRKKNQPKLELVIQSTEMNDFMHRINNMPIFIRVLNPKRIDLRLNQTNSTVIDNEMQKSFTNSQSIQSFNETSLSLNPLPSIEDSRATNQHLVNSSIEEDVFAKMIIPTLEEDVFLKGFIASANDNNSINSEIQVLQDQLNGSGALSQHISNDFIVQDNSFSHLGEESKANVEVATSNEPLQLIPIFFDNEFGTSDLNGDFVDFQFFKDSLDSHAKGSTQDDLVDVTSLNNYAQGPNHNTAIDNPEIPLSLNYVVSTPYKEFEINGQLQNPISIDYDTNGAFTHRIDSGNKTDYLLDDSLNINDNKILPSLEYVDLFPYAEFNPDGHPTYDVVEVLKNDDDLNNATDELNNFQNIKETKNVYDLSPLREYIDIIPYSNIDNNGQGSVLIPQEKLSIYSTDRLSSSNLTHASLQNAVDRRNYYDISPPIENDDFIEYTDIDHNGGNANLIIEDPSYHNIVDGFMVNNQNVIENSNGYDRSEPVEYIDFLELKNLEGDGQGPNTPQSQYSTGNKNIIKINNRNSASLPNRASSGIQELPSNNKYIDFMHFRNPSEEAVRDDQKYYLIQNYPVDDISKGFKAENQNRDTFPERRDTENISMDNKYIDFMHYNDPLNNNQESSVAGSQSSDSFFTIKDDQPATFNDQGQFFLLDDEVNFRAADQSRKVYSEMELVPVETSQDLQSSSLKYGTRILQDRPFENEPNIKLSDIVDSNEYQYIPSLRKASQL